ncbi:PEP/pyruvate-binding domain-containing protein [Arthrobacter sp. B2a2-09]|uniref:PEP/pyruvate-binding domain-containing protein n=1 Tax=Arthrobacter sp. B2a2-09 TaxID=2952822 RepID=UPI0022CD8392|nr:PEP/pyruvate-binding domain-containing protein [Arthrobacter sp. B2a2-09]MCZ9882757.1 PEP-utilizing enzyme [Arthrobacter sp. B2a2-09]
MIGQATAPLADFGVGDVAVAGGKGAALGELVRQGFPVPQGFIITTGAYLSFLAETKVGAALGRFLSIEPDEAPDSGVPDGGVPDGGDGTGGAALRALFAAAEMPGRLRQEILEAYARLGAGAVAVRSSATAEDLPGAAFAGQQDTYLNVRGGDDVVRAVASCWGSLWTDRAVAYRRRQRIDPHEVAIAVVVQKMVPAAMAGVMFTANPVTGERGEMVVDANPGLGEAVVSGRVTPEHYVLDGSGKVLSFTPGGREVVISAAEGGGTQESSGTHGAKPGLAAEELAELATLGEKAQHHFGRPQDIEWAAAGGTLYVLQSRPMTALPPQPPVLNAVQRRVGPFFIEMFQERPYPLDVSGWMSRGILAMLHGMAGSVGVAFPTVEELLPEEEGVVVQLIPPVPRPTIRTLAAPVSLLRRAGRFKAGAWTQDPRFSLFLDNIERLNGKDLGPLRWRAVIAFAEECFAAMQGITDLRVSYLPGILVPVLKMRFMLLFLGKMKLAPALIAGAQTRTSQANRALERLASIAADDPGLSRALQDSGPRELLDLMEREPAHRAFREAFEAFQLEYGHRETTSVVLSSSPTWSDAPEVVLGLVKAMSGERPQTYDQAGNALAELKRHPALRFEPLRRRVLAAVESAQAGMAFREDSHFYATKAIPPIRRAYRELGRRLVQAGVIDEPDEIHHLRFEELESITDADDGALPASLRGRFRPLVLARAAKRRELEGIPLLDPALLFGRGRQVEGILVSGTAASRGQATGPVRVIRGPAEFGRLRSGEVLVCPYTNPAWTPLFQRAAAVVVDAGGLGSHAAIVAREYGIPAVMGTGSGTSTLTDGQRVFVDGTLGVVLPAALAEGP